MFLTTWFYLEWQWHFFPGFAAFLSYSWKHLKSKHNRWSTRSIKQYCDLYQGKIWTESAVFLKGNNSIIYSTSRTPVTRTLKGNEKQFKLARIWVIGVNFSEVLMKGREILMEFARNSSYPSLIYWGRLYQQSSESVQNLLFHHVFIVKLKAVKDK